MSNAPGDRRPRFEMITFSAPTSIPHGWDAELLRRGVPKARLVYDAANQLTLVEDPEHGQLVCFGTHGRHIRICLDPRSGHVVDVLCDDRAKSQPREATSTAEVIRSAWLVNSSLDQFIASVRVVVNRFPFDSGDAIRASDWDDHAIALARAEQLEREWDQAVEDLTETLRRIDPVALADDGFWRTFLDDVQMGNYATSDILRDGGQ